MAINYVPYLSRNSFYARNTFADDNKIYKAAVKKNKDFKKNFKNPVLTMSLRRYTTLPVTQFLFEGDRIKPKVVNLIKKYFHKQLN